MANESSSEEGTSEEGSSEEGSCQEGPSQEAQHVEEAQRQELGGEVRVQFICNVVPVQGHGERLAARPTRSRPAASAPGGLARVGRPASSRGGRSTTRRTRDPASAGQRLTASSAGTWSRPARIGQKAAPVAAARVDGQQGDRHHHHRPESFIEGAGTTLKAAVDVARKTGVALDGRSALPHPDEDVHGQREHVLRQLRAAQDRGLLQPPPQPAELEDVAGDGWPDPRRIQRRLVVGQRRGQRRQHRRLPPRHGSRRPRRSASSATEPTGGSSSATAGARLWGDNGFGYLHPDYIAAAFFDESYGVTL